MARDEGIRGETEWLGWKPGQRNITWDRTIISVTGNEVTIDVPITTAMEKQMGGGYIQSIQWPGQIQRAGIRKPDPGISL
ncbi:MAG: hypothetical protein MZV63_58080 [Marinilabiliales bacterium]|nr:hypothetical protein [Marinilabiliales bacterium]